MTARIKSPITTNPDVMNALVALDQASSTGGLPQRTVELIRLRASQINGCSTCVCYHSEELKKGGETDQRVFAVAAWRETVLFTDAERAALALTEATTRVSDRADPVTDKVWDEASRYYDEHALADLVLQIAQINFWNRVGIATKQAVGEL